MKKLAVLLPTYNAVSYLKVSIDSILNQTFFDFDLYIYDDCSTDKSQEIILDYKDSRVIYRKNKSNLGIAKTLNLGLQELLPNYEFIARMDADDWAYPERFQKQLDYLNAYKEVVLCGTQGYWLKDINQNPISGWEYPIRYEFIKKYLLFGASFGHSSVIMRSDFFKKYQLRYNEDIRTCEDWELWMRVLQLGKGGNLPYFLMKYRVLENSNHRSVEKLNQHLLERARIISCYWSNFKIELAPELVYDFYYNKRAVSKTEFIRNSKLAIKAFNELYEKSTLDLNDKERGIFGYLLARKILNYWKRSTVSRTDLLIWIELTRAIRFINKVKWIKSLIR